MIALKNISVHRPQPSGKNQIILEDISLRLDQGSITALFGANGSGKTTLLNIIAGIINPSSGVCSFASNNPRIAYVFQDYRNSLLPWRTLKSNITLPSKWSGRDIASSEKYLSELTAGFSTNLPLERFPHQVSGGQAQVACLLRAFLHQPDILILDEPTSALDYSMQWQTVLEIQKIAEKTGVTILMVSHDPDQALLLANRVVVLGENPGRIIGDMAVNLPRPRSLDMVSSLGFSRHKEERVFSS